MAAGSTTEATTRLRRPAAVLWDLDGTLVDSEPLWAVALNEVAEQLGRPLTPEVRQSMTGTDGPTTMRLLAQHTGYPADDTELAAWHDRIVARVIDLVAHGLPVMPHAAGALHTLGTNGIPQALVTSSPRCLAERALERLGESHFTTVVTADDVSQRKPDPGPYLVAAQRLGAASAHCWAVEDSPSGARAAESAGCVVLLAPTAAPQAHGPGRLALTSLAQIAATTDT